MELIVQSGSRRTETWNVAISGYNHRGRHKKAVEWFKWMITESVRPDSATMASVLPAYSELADLLQAKEHSLFLSDSWISWEHKDCHWPNRCVC
jgi:pentatricopeptide repeat protein